MQEGGRDGVCSQSVFFAGFVMGIPVVFPFLYPLRSHLHRSPVPTTFPLLLSSCPHPHRVRILSPPLSPFLSCSQTHCAPVPIAIILLSPLCSHLSPTATTFPFPLPPSFHPHPPPVPVILPSSPLQSQPRCPCAPTTTPLLSLPPRCSRWALARATGKSLDLTCSLKSWWPWGHHQKLLQPGVPPCQTCSIHAMHHVPATHHPVKKLSPSWTRGKEANS